MSYHYTDNKNGYQYISEASELDKIGNNKYDFLLSCHSLEHIANPVKTLKHWNKVLQNGGKIILVLPDKDFTFDHNRPYTNFEHLLQDFKAEIDEHDTTHFEEILRLHDVSKDKMINSREELKSRIRDNFSNRCVHHHVYSLHLIKELLNYCDFKVLYQQKAKPFHLVTVAEKMSN
jgi:ubiquinone/menaquinone biosynthesis C-methylase UbiE